MVGKDIGDIKLVCSGAGAAAIACLDLMCRVGVQRDNVWVCDSKGLIYEGRDAQMEPHKRATPRTPTCAPWPTLIEGADVFLGVSAAGALKPRWWRRWRIDHHPRARQPRAGDPSGTGQVRAPRRHHRHRAFGLSEPE